MQGLEHYLIQPREALLDRARANPGDLADLLTEPELMVSEVRPPSYPRDDYDRGTYVKVVFLAALEAEYAGPSDFVAFWDGDPPRSVAEFDRYWTLQVLSAENFASFEQDAARAPDALRACIPTGSSAVDDALAELGRGGAPRE